MRRRCPAGGRLGSPAPIAGDGSGAEPRLPSGAQPAGEAHSRQSRLPPSPSGRRQLVSPALGHPLQARRWGKNRPGKGPAQRRSPGARGQRGWLGPSLPWLLLPTGVRFGGLPASTGQPADTKPGLAESWAHPPACRAHRGTRTQASLRVCGK